MSRTLRTFCFTSFLLPALGFCLAQAEPLTPQASTPNEVRSSLNGLPSWSKTLSFEKLGRSSDSLLLGIHNSDQIVFSMRHDRIASDVRLQLEYTPSPALLPLVSHLRVYLNDVLMSVVPIAKDQLGAYRQLRSSSLILAWSATSIPGAPGVRRALFRALRRSRKQCVMAERQACRSLLIQEQALSLQNDLAYFPMPFFDTRGQDQAMVNMVFAESPTLGEQRAAGILSCFGSLAGWRGTQFPVLFDQLPAVGEHNRAMPSIVFANNEHRPKMLADLQKFPLVQAPSIQIIDNPADAYSKVRLVLGRNEDDLVTAAQTLALGGLLSGSQMTLDTVRDIPRRQPYDAPNWMRVRSPDTFRRTDQVPRATASQWLAAAADQP